jgi:hypothetical protein
LARDNLNLTEALWRGAIEKRTPPSHLAEEPPRRARSVSTPRHDGPPPQLTRTESPPPRDTARGDADTASDERTGAAGAAAAGGGLGAGSDGA